MIPRYENTVDLIEQAFKKYADRPAFTCTGHTLSYSEVDKLSYQFACYLKNVLGLKTGDRVAIQLPNILQYPVVSYAIIRAGLVIVNTNPLYTPREVKHQLVDSGAKALIVLSNIANNAAEIIDQTSVEKVIVTNFADLHPAPKRVLINSVVKYVKKMIPDFHFENQVSFRAALSQGANQEIEIAKVAPDSINFLQYTGGTTGVAKGAMLSHGNMASNVWQMISHLPGAFNESEEVFVACLPMYHIYALNIHAFCAFSRGAHNILIPNPRDLQSFVDALKNHSMTFFVGINTLYTALTRFEPFRTQVDFSKLKISSAGGMALTEDAAKSWEALTGCKVIEGYGLTETSPVACSNLMNDIRLGTIGVPIAETEVKIIDNEHNAVPANTPGELCIKGPQVMLGYWQNEEETNKVMFGDGWFKTGDIAQIEDDGCIRIVDRKKDMILVSGFNVYPNELEDVLASHDGIIEAAAVGVPDDKCGEVVKVFIVRSEEALTKEEVVSYCREKLTAYKVPKYVEFKDELPKSNVGKILRRELRVEDCA